MPGTPQPHLGFLLHDVARLLRRNFNRRVAELGLSQAQWQVLAYLSRSGGMNQAQLAEMMEVTPIAVARLIDRMEAAGWVARRRDPDDRRAFRLDLKPAAEPMLKKMRAIGAEVRGAAMEGLPDSARDQLQEILSVMRANLCDRARAGDAA